MNELELEYMFEMQKQLDESVAERTGMRLDSYEALEKREYAFHTEVHELANEISFFKYWKKSHVIDRDSTLEELVDCIHFLLSIGLTKGYERTVKRVTAFELWEDYDMIELFKELRRNELDSVGRWVMAFSLLLGVGLKCGFTIQDINKAYQLKNAVNEVRQLEGY